MLDHLPSKFVETGNFTTHYIEAGSGEPLILLHGGGAGADSRGNWAKCLPIYADRMHVYAMDYVGFGYSDAPDPAGFTYDQAARNRQLIDFIEALDIGPVHVIGNSMGGATAIGGAVERPDLFKSAVLMGSAGLNRRLEPALLTLIHYDFTLSGMRRVCDALTHPSNPVSDDVVRYRFEQLERPAYRASYGATMGWVKDQGGLHYSEDFVARMKTRALIFNGKDDRIIPPADAYRFLELIEGSHGYIVPECGHWAMMEKTKLFTRTTLDFIGDYPG